MRKLLVLALCLGVGALAGCGEKNSSPPTLQSANGTTPSIPGQDTKNVQARSSLTNAAFHDWFYFAWGGGGWPTNDNSQETTISNSNVRNLHLLWSVDLGEKIDASPVIYAHSYSGDFPSQLFIGTEGGKFYSMDPDSGSILWSKQLGSYGSSGCPDLGGSPFGISGSAAITRSRARVFVADGQNNVYAFSISNGSQPSGWPISLGASVANNHVYSGLAFNGGTGYLYASTAGYCDFPGWQGRITAIDSRAGVRRNTFFPSATSYGGNGYGGGIWGPMAAAIDWMTGDVLVTTGNCGTSPGGTGCAHTEHDAYNEHLVRLDQTLSTVKASSWPNGVNGVGDVDFGATPSIFQTSNCSTSVAAMNKIGLLPQWQFDSIGNGPTQQLQLAAPDSSGNFIGMPAYSTETQTLYVSNYSNLQRTQNVGELDALTMNGNCTLQTKWKTVIPNANPYNSGNQPFSPPATANGVVYMGSGMGHTVYAIDANTGAQLWNSGNTIQGPIFAAPVIDGHLFVASWDHHLYAFGP